MSTKILNLTAYIFVIFMSLQLNIEKYILSSLSSASLKSFRAKIQYYYLKRNMNNNLLRWAEITIVKKHFIVNPCSSMFKWIYFKTGDYELNTTNFIYNNLEEGDVFVDIGANAGYFTIIAASKVGEDGLVYAFEPNPKLSENLKLSLEKNNLSKRVEVINKAISNSDSKTEELYMSNDNSNDGISSLKPGEIHLESGDLSKLNTMEVETITFDNFIINKSKNNIKIIKIDIEGAEYEALQGMHDFLVSNKPKYLICETTMNNNVCELLTNYGYKYEPIEYLVPEEKWGNILFTYAE